MASVKLTNTIRDNILRDMLIHRFRAEADALFADFAALARDVYDDLFTKAEAKARDALPDGWLRTEDDVEVRFGTAGRDGYEQLQFNGLRYGGCCKVATRKDPLRLRVPAKFCSGCSKIYDEDHPFTGRQQVLRNREQALVAAIDSAEKSGKAALYSASTIARLKVLWPEVAPFCAAYNDDDRVHLPALPIAALNATFGLPVEEAA